MSANDLAEWLNSQRDRIDRDAEGRKDSHSALLELMDIYRQLSTDERTVAARVVVEWILSDDHKKRFDGLALVNEFRIASAVPALEELLSRLRRSDEPLARFDVAKIDRILARLSAP